MATIPASPPRSWKMATYLYSVHGGGGSGCHIFGAPGAWEIRDENGNFVSTGLLRDTRDTAAAVVLSNGSVFITGGNTSPATWEIRNSAGALVSSGSLVDTRYGGHSDTHF